MLANPELAGLIHRNLAVVLSFAFSRAAVNHLLNDQFTGEWKYLRKTVFEVSEHQADRALVEMAVQLRILDDEQDIGGAQTRSDTSLGTVAQADGSETNLYVRDFTNKVLHSARLEWICTNPMAPIVVAHSRDPTRWQTARISIVGLMTLLGNIMH